MLAQAFRIDWSQAAIIAAIIAGVFALTKELATFTLDRLKTRWNTASERRRTKAKLSHFYLQLAVGAGKSLRTWEDTVRELREMGLLLGPEAPSLEFLTYYSDPQLALQVGELADECPEVLFSYDHALNLQRSVKRVEVEERETFGGAKFYYSYPRTRRSLGLLLQHSVKALEESCGLLPLNFWDPDRGPRASFMKEVTHLRALSEEIPIPSNQEVAREALEAMARLPDASDSPELQQAG
jgi:hypothetical protein